MSRTMRAVSIHARRARMRRHEPRHHLQRMPRSARWTWIALLAAATYYAGAQLGFALTFPSSSSLSIIWPPNALLFVVLLLISPRRWWVALAAVAPAHLLVAWQNGLPATATVGLYVSNCAEALLAAALVRRFAGGPPWLVGLRRMVVYVGSAVVVAPLVTSFLDAGVQVATGLGHDYWLLWQERLLSDALTLLTVPPALLAAASYQRSRLRRVPPLRVLEAALLAVGLFTAGFVVFGPLGLRPIAEPTIVYEMLPLLLWAALRFGVGGSSAALLGVTLLASIWSASQGAVLSGTSAAGVHHILMLQAQLLAMAIPILLLAACIQEHNQAQQALRQSWQHYRAFFDLTAVGASEADPATGQLLRVNDAFCQITGYPREEILRLSFRDLTHPEDREEDWRRFHRAVEDGICTWRVEKRYVRKDGQAIWVRVESTIVRDETGQPIYTATIIQDITERKQMEQALRTSEARYRDLVETQTELICRYRPETTLTFVNDAFCRWYQRPREELLGRKFIDFMDGAAREHHLQYTAALQAHGHSETDEHEVVLPDGSIGWQQWTDHLICDAAGQVVEIQAIGRDITERRRLEQEREAARAEAERKSEELDRIFETIADGVVVFDAQGQVVRENATMRRLVEMDAGPPDYYQRSLSERMELFAACDVQGRPLRPDEGPLPRVLRGEVLTGAETMDLCSRTLGGRELVLNLSVAPLRDQEGRLVGAVAIFHDQTERAQMEQALRTSEERYRDLVETQSELICRYRLDGTLTFVNGAYCRHFGRSREDLIGLVFLDLLPTAQAERARAGLASRARLAHRPAIVSDEHEVVLPDGSLGWQQWVEHPIFDAHGQVVELQAIGRDTTERKRAEEALRASEKRLRTAFDSAGTGMMVVDTAGRCLQANRRYSDMLGYSEEELYTLTFAEYTYPDDVEDNLVLFRQALAGEIESYQMEKRYIHKQGHVVWGTLSAGVVRDDAGKPLYLVAQVQDITERKRLEQEREAARAEAERRSEELDRIFETMADAVFVYDAQGRTVRTNTAANILIGLDAAPRDYYELPGPDRVSLFQTRDAHGRSLASDDLASKRALRGEVLTGTSALDIVSRTIDGRELALNVSAAPLRDAAGRILGAVAIARDQTERVRMEEALRASEARYRAVVQTQTELISRIAPDMTITFVNEAMCRYLGKSQEELVGTRVMEHLPESIRRRAEANMQSLLTQPQVLAAEHEVTVPDGSTRWLAWVIQPILDADGQVVELQGAGRDITERKQAAEALEYLTARLLQVQDEERRRLARDLHDGTAQTLTALDLNLTTLQGFTRGSMRDTRRFARLLADSQALGEQAMREMRTMSYLLHPPELDEAGLVPAVRSYVQGFSRRSGIHVDLVAPKDLGRLPMEVERALFRIIQECLTNVHRHSGSATARIVLKQSASAVHLRVVDAGRGLGEVAPAGTEEPYSEVNVLGVGIPGMRQRLSQLGGKLGIRFTRHGTMVIAMVPVQRGELRRVRTAIYEPPI